MTREEQLYREVIDDLLNSSSEKLYQIFGSWLETVVEEKKEVFRTKLKNIWRNRKWYAFHDTGEQFESDTMSIYFTSRKLKSYSLREMEMILEKIDSETVYCNPKKQNS